VAIQGYKSIDCCHLRLDPRITVLVGKNEAGKTNILRAIQALSPRFEIDLERDTRLREGKPEFVFELNQFSKSDLRTMRVLAKNAQAKVDALNSSGSKAPTTLQRLVSALKNPVRIEAAWSRRAAKEGLLNLKVNSAPVTDDDLKRKLAKLVPSVRYYEPEDISLLPGEMPIAQISKRANAALRNLLAFCGLDINLLKRSDQKRDQALRAANEKLNGLVHRYWAQDTTIELMLSVDGDSLRIRVSDETGTVDHPAERSEGTWWFISLLFHLGVFPDKKGTSDILLLDEPGLSLHPSAQRTLLSVLETLALTHQIVYTTHLPFMIDRKAMHRIRLVEKDRNGTRVVDKPHGDSFSAVRNSLGLLLGESLVFNRFNIVVEGISDSILLGTAARAAARCQTTSLDYDSVSVVVAEDRSTALALGAFLTAENLGVVLLSDADREGVQRSRVAEDRGIPAMLVGSPCLPELAECTIEDLIPRAIYLQAVRRFYAGSPLDEKTRFQHSDIDTAQPIIPQLKDIIGEKPNRRGIAECVSEIVDAEDEAAAAVAASFSPLFERINEIFHHGGVSPEARDEAALA